jgi:polyferredoxin
LARKQFNWRNLRRWVQVISLVGWIVGFLLVAQTWVPTALSHWLVLVDPALSWNQAIASRILARWVFPGLILFLSALVVGRAWCGWLCPLGTSFDLFSHFVKPTRKIKVPDNFRKVKFLLLFAIIIAAIFGNLTLLFLDPITIWLRVMTGGVWPVLNRTFTAA